MTDRLLEILYNRIWDETSAFERKEAGSPFLPNTTDKAHFAKMLNSFQVYCIDIEKILKISLLDQYFEFGHTPCVYHINYMTIPKNDLYIDSTRDSNHIYADQNTTNSKAKLLEIFDQIEEFVNDGSGGFTPRPLGANPITVDFPFALILYVGGDDSLAGKFDNSNKSEMFFVGLNIFSDDGDESRKNIKYLKSVFNAASPSAYISLHHTAMHAPPDASPIVKERISAAAQELQSGQHFALSESGSKALEALTLHFQRQWGDREAQLRADGAISEARAKVRGMVAHDLTRNLHAALKNLSAVSRIAKEEQVSATLQFAITAAEESVRSGYAAPWLERAAHKGGLPEIWRAVSPPSEAELKKLFALFDRKLMIQCNGFPWRPKPRKLLRRQWLEGCMFGEPREFLFGANAKDMTNAELAVEAGQDIWPLLRGPSGATIDTEGRLALLFAPHTELVRNALEACETIGIDEHDVQIYVDLYVKKDGSCIKGIVRNLLPDGTSISQEGQKRLEDKIESMTIDMCCKVKVEENWIEIAWILKIDDRDLQGE